MSVYHAILCQFVLNEEQRLYFGSLVCYVWKQCTRYNFSFVCHFLDVEREQGMETFSWIEKNYCGSFLGFSKKEQSSWNLFHVPIPCKNIPHFIKFKFPLIIFHIQHFPISHETSQWPSTLLDLVVNSLSNKTEKIAFAQLFAPKPDTLSPPPHIIIVYEEGCDKEEEKIST